MKNYKILSQKRFYCYKNIINSLLFFNGIKSYIYFNFFNINDISKNDLKISLNNKINGMENFYFNQINFIIKNFKIFIIFNDGVFYIDNKNNITIWDIKSFNKGFPKSSRLKKNEYYSILLLVSSVQEMLKKTNVIEDNKKLFNLEGYGNEFFFKFLHNVKYLTLFINNNRIKIVLSRVHEIRIENLCKIKILIFKDKIGLFENILFNEKSKDLNEFIQNFKSKYYFIYFNNSLKIISVNDKGFLKNDI